MENSLSGPDPAERHFIWHKIDEWLNLKGVVKDNGITTLEGSVVTVFDCNTSGNESSLGYTFTDREGAYSIYIPKPPDCNGLIGFKERTGKRQPEEIHDNISLKKAHVKINSIRTTVFQGQTCIQSEGFYHPDSYNGEPGKKFRQGIGQGEGEHPGEERAPGKERILLEKAIVKVNYISVNVIQHPIHKTSEGFGHPGACKGELCEQLREDIVQGELSEEGCMPVQEEILQEEILNEETISTQAEYHRAEHIHAGEAGESEYRQPDLEQTLTDKHISSSREEPNLTVLPNRVDSDSPAPIEEKADNIKACMERISGVYKKKILTCIIFFFAGVALLQFHSKESC
ncbi:MAG: hypothetical protein A4E55_02056 [Pelotomaculum sp. PtaU1.Bin035]|nr:MAG: hypothetical protein A4E55_02056 [Pelotomaculum sp. PtaU1.Bin035]